VCSSDLLLRVVLDSRLRVPLESRLIRSVKSDTAHGGGDVLVFNFSGDDKKKTELESRGVRVEEPPAVLPDGRPDLATVLRRLGELEITSLMIEGGSTLNGAALAARIVDKVFLYYAPKIFGGGAVPFAAGAGFRPMSEAAHVERVHLHRFGEDFAVEGYLRDPYKE
jgi:diaminohydroxyphosphoribosylaminopyrimidine deaminase/5-amino-6-(5-phosphoribosylamino)uracil reductase